MFSKPVVQWGVVALAFAIIVITTQFDGQNGEPRTSEIIPSAANDADLPFDFYVLALSWSPAFCASQAGSNADRQCNSGADYRFITHGLWPQFEEGWPSFCQSPHGDQMPAGLAQRLLPVMPSYGLIEHQWDKHGTCSGLNQDDYVDRILRASAGITIPQAFLQTPPRSMDANAVEQAFQQANPGLSGGAVAVRCQSGALSEVRICLDLNLSPRQCAQVNGNGCRQDNLDIEPPRR